MRNRTHYYVADRLSDNRITRAYRAFDATAAPYTGITAREVTNRTFCDILTNFGEREYNAIIDRAINGAQHDLSSDLWTL